MKTTFALLALAAPIALAAVPAQAAVYRFNLSGAYTATWTIDTNAPDGYADADQGFGHYGVAGTFGGVAGRADSVNFFHQLVDGGLSIETGAGIRAFTGTQLYTGSEKAPVFRIGTFSLDGGTTTLSIAASAVPEPSTWLLTIVGFGALGASMRVRRTRARIALRTC